MKYISLVRVKFAIIPQMFMTWYSAKLELSNEE